MTDLSNKVARECMDVADEKELYLSINYFSKNGESCFAFYKGPVISNNNSVGKIVLKEGNKSIKFVDGDDSFRAYFLGRLRDL